MKKEQQIELKQRLATLNGRERKELSRRAAELRQQAQRRNSGPESSRSIEQWMLDLLSKSSEPESVLVIESHGSRCVIYEGEEKSVEVHHSAGPVVPGDRVVLSKGSVREVLPRRTILSRRDPFYATKQLPIVANVDFVGVVVSCISPPLHPRLIDRYLAAIWRGGAEPVIVLNKTDLHSNEEALEADREKLQPYRDLGIPVFETSAESFGLDGLVALLSRKLSTFVGHSGVGKSTIVNRLIEGANASTGNTSEYSSKGRHTTTASTLHRGGDLQIIDTPGVREFGVEFGSPQELAACFREFPAGCRFSDCSHLSEEGCVVLEAVAAGRLNRARYDSYRRLMAEAFPKSAHPPDASFTCRNCGAEVQSEGGGTKHRNHCPLCLHSQHLDLVPGDRLSACGGVMDPVAVWVRRDGEWAVIHRCRKCGHFSSNRIAADDNEMLLMSLAVKPLASPPFPLERLER